MTLDPLASTLTTDPVSSAPNCTMARYIQASTIHQRITQHSAIKSRKFDHWVLRVQKIRFSGMSKRSRIRPGGLVCQLRQPITCHSWNVFADQVRISKRQQQHDHLSYVASGHGVRWHTWEYQCFKPCVDASALRVRAKVTQLVLFIVATPLTGSSHEIKTNGSASLWDCEHRRGGECLINGGSGLALLVDSSFECDGEGV